MEVMNLVLAILGHVMASIFYVIRKVRSPFSSSPKAIVDRSSILERKAELRKLWEKKMADEQQAAITEEVINQEEVKKEIQTNGSVKIANGVANGEIPKHGKDTSVIEEAIIIDVNNTDERKLSKINGSPNLIDIDENSNEEIIPKQTIEAETKIAQIREEAKAIVENTVTVAAEKIYTSTLQQTLVFTQNTDITTTIEKEQKKEDEEIISTLVQEKEKENEEITTPINQTSIVENIEDQEDFEEIERRIEAEECMAQGVEQDLLTSELVEMSTVDKLDLTQELGSNVAFEDSDEKGEHTLSSNADSLEALNHGVEDEEDFVCVGDAVFAGDLSSEDKDPLIMNGYTASSTTPVTDNGEQDEKTFDDHFVLDTRELESPSSDKVIEKLGKISSRFKTEQPYSTCTTETKIAMEIREMREREEELKTMRERQAQLSPQPQPSAQQPAQKFSPTVHKFTPTNVQKPKQTLGYMSNSVEKIPTTPPYLPNTIEKVPTPSGYRVSSVFGPRVSPQVPKEVTKCNFNKESPVEREIRLAKDREEELRKQKGLPPREDDSFVKPSEVKSAQAKVFGKILNAENSRLLATAKIQHEIEEQTLRELALRESGSIQTLSSERTDSRVTKLKPLETPECVSPTYMNGNSSLYTNGNYTNGHISPDVLSKRSTPSPTGPNSSYSLGSRTSPMMGVSGLNKGISMQKFIASRGKDTTFSGSRNGFFPSKPDLSSQQDITTQARSTPEPGKLKRTLSVESKIQQEILEMKLREEELKIIHSGHNAEVINEAMDQYNGNGISRDSTDYQNGQNEMEDLCPRKSNLIAQWEQRIQNAA